MRLAGGLIALVAGSLLWLGADWVAAQRLPPASEPQASMVQS